MSLFGLQLSSKCYFCGQEGHDSTDCVTCYCCGKSHKTEECPTPRCIFDCGRGNCKKGNYQHRCRKCNAYSMHRTKHCPMNNTSTSTSISNFCSVSK